MSDKIDKKWIVTTIECGKLPFYELGRDEERIITFLPRQPRPILLATVWREAWKHRNKLNAHLIQEGL